MNDVICGDCLDAMSGMPAGSVDLVVTSPPYADRRKKQYGGVPASEYVKWFMPRAAGMRRVLRERGSLVIVIKEHTVGGERSEYVMDLIKAMRRGGWKWIDEYVWHKPNPSPGRWPSRLKDGWEHCLHFSKTIRPVMFPEAVAAPSKAKSLKRSTAAYKNNDLPHGNRHGMGGVTHASIAKSAKRIGYQSKKTGSGFNYDYSGDDDRYFALPSNVITAGIICHNIKHPAVFPIEIPTFFIKLFTQTGDAVMDPFCGSGTTLLAASKLGRRYIGIDTSAEYCNNASLPRRRGTAGHGGIYMRKAGTIFDDLDYEFIAQMSNLGTWYWRGQDPGVRHERRQAPLWMAMNMAAGKCWCGCPKSKWEKRQQRYCRPEHGRWWHFYIEAYWASFRCTIIERDGFTCAECGFHTGKPIYYDEKFVGLAVDHIHAISLGGECYDESNVQTLCAGCHAKKTASDAAKLAEKKRLDRTIGTGHQSRTLEAWA